VRLWRPTGEQFAQFAGHYGALATEVLGADFGAAGLAFSPDSWQIAIAEADGRVRPWRIQPLDELLEQACRWLRAYLDSL
jgi:hypothetical protein